MNYPIILARNLTKNPGKACFLHRMLLKMRRVPEEAVLRTECPLRTIGGRFRYRVLRGKLLPLRNFEHTKQEADHLVDLLLYYTVMSHVFGMLRKR